MTSAEIMEIAIAAKTEIGRALEWMDHQEWEKARLRLQCALAALTAAIGAGGQAVDAPAVKALEPAEASLLDAMSKNICLELSWGEVSDFEGEPCQWRVHERTGNRSDREWHLRGVGDTPRAALEAALSASAPAPSQPDGEIERLRKERDEHERMRNVYVTSAQEEHARAEAAESRAEALRADGQFLLDRLNDFIADADDMPSMTRNWFGHVEPAMGRFRVSLLNGEKGRG